MDLSNARWVKATRSSNGGDTCVEVAVTDRAVGVRDSKDTAGPALVFAPGGWAGFVAGVKAGTFDPR